MAASSTVICNLALSHLAISKTIASLTEQSQEARACSAFYELARDATLRDAPWPFAKRFAALALVEEDPIDEWGFAYRVPANCFFFRRVRSGLQQDTRASRIPYELGSDASGKLVYTNKEDAECEYTVQITDTLRFDSDFTTALSFRIAGMIAPRVTGGDPFKLGDRALKLYQFEISKATAQAFNEEQPAEPPDSEFINARS